MSKSEMTEYSCFNAADFINLPTFYNVYLCHDVPQHGTKQGTKHGTLLLIYICTTMYHNMTKKHGTKYGTLLLMYICTTMYHNMLQYLVQNMVHFY